ncbi:bifunctional hydroxymethylpyrimidine kinase/phosphomethylpyrimidine kinase [Lactobacillus sp. S2-2]|uniref:bifunctional hydroxymethylpyrimidine kinase/phosphomethylpyrimidine kinase n=1 Tax=Lactobacillus sp. S2-2 TaxID=2692917 RepID=UPI001F02B94F|nr:bifunctional hydroxymethylpyrimidine kinase/phosphomethylpyrimidine kinase [Lactobacillus sp. S2-2]MCF6514691.1 bifunctional hydroxymethylpyrimidine kinase/phosphomethylpyrimidine kinase [Lactobacillus sp. S2-2]
MNEINQYPEVLTIAGTDSGGGAGIQADTKTMQAYEVFSTQVIVGVTAQNTIGVQELFPLPASIIASQFKSVFGDFDIKALKTGALFDKEHVQIVVDNLKQYSFNNLVIDPVMVAKGGAKLLSDDAIATLKQNLLPLGTLVTPNLLEAEILCDQEIKTYDDMKMAAKKIRDLGVENVMIKGGHTDNQTEIYDYVLFSDDTDLWLNAPRIDTKRTHGTGDTLSSAIISNLAKGFSLKEAIKNAHEYLKKIIKNPLLIGHGHGPLNHGNWEN